MKWFTVQLIEVDGEEERRVRERGDRLGRVKRKICEGD